MSSALLALVFWGLGWLSTWEAVTWDWRVSLLASPGNATDDIRLILLDQRSLDWAEEENGLPWPWPRELYAALINYCRRSGVKAMAFDVLLTEFSKYGVEDDAALGKAIERFPHFASAVFLGNDRGKVAQDLTDFPFPTVSIGGLDEWLNRTNARKDLDLSRIDLPIPEVLHTVDILCNVQLKADFDGVYRRMTLFHLFDQHVFPTLGLGVYLAACHDISLEIHPGRLTLDSTSLPINHKGQVILRYRGPAGTYQSYSAAEVLQAEVRRLRGEEPTENDIRMASDLKEKYVLFGFSAPGLYDLRPTPVGGVYPGVEINATVLDNLLSEDFIADAPLWAAMIIVVFLAVGCAVLASFLSNPITNVLTGILFLSLPVFLSFGFYLQGFWMPLMVQEVTIVLTIIVSLAVNYSTEGRQKRFIKDAFKHYLSPAVIEQLIVNPAHLRLGGERRTLSIFFSDIQGFTSISERLNPEELTTLLNDYLSAMTGIIQEEQGTVDKYEGDAIIAFWNAPLSVPDHAIRVVRAALRCQQKLAELRPVFRERIRQDMFMRIGMNTGPAVVGNMGSHSRFDYTMLGDAVNLAARLEGVNKQFGTYSMISQVTLDLLEDTFAARELARVAVVGRRVPVTVYEPMFHSEYNAKKDILETFVQGLYLFYEGKFRDALHIFMSIQEYDPAAASYVSKCQEILQHPPAADWLGVWVMTVK